MTTRPSEPATRTPGRLRADSIGAVGVVLLVVACASPLAALIGNMPLGFTLGDGAGMPGAFLLAGVILVFFAFGFVALAPHVSNAAAFYAYVRAGLGERAGRAAAFVATLGYHALAAGLLGLVGYFSASVFTAELGITAPWEVYTFGALALVVGLGALGIDAGVKLLVVLLGAEGLLITAATIVTFVRHGDGVTIASFTPATVFAGAPGVALMFALISYIGFEATAVFAEEARDRARTIKRATIGSVIVITVIYTAAATSAVAFYGAGAVSGVDPSNFYGAIVVDALGDWSGHAVNILLVTSLFATLLAIHNMASRYLFGLGRDGLLPASLGRTSSRGAPVTAGLVQGVIVGAVALVYAVLQLDPYLNLATTMLGVGTIAIVVLQAAAGIAVIAFFRRRRDLATGAFSTLIAPALGSLGLLAACYLVTVKFSLLTGTDSVIVNSLPVLVPIVAVVGAFVPRRATAVDAVEIGPS